MIYLQLLLSYLKIGFFGFGGGYAMLSLIQNEIVVQRGWLTSEQLTDIIAISQVTPGPIGAPAPHPRNLHRLEKLGDTRRRLPRFVQKGESYPHHRPLGSGRVIALSVTEPIQTILP